MTGEPVITVPTNKNTLQTIDDKCARLILFTKPNLFSQVAAQDDDLGLFGQVRYSMGSDGEAYFSINEVSGEVSTLVQFDREIPAPEAFIVSGQVIVQFTYIIRIF